jgi:hypothetical protein
MDSEREELAKAVSGGEQLTDRFGTTISLSFVWGNVRDGKPRATCV